MKKISLLLCIILLCGTFGGCIPTKLYTQEEILAIAEQKYGIVEWYQERAEREFSELGFEKPTDEDLAYYYNNFVWDARPDKSFKYAYGKDANAVEKIVYYQIRMKKTADAEKMVVARDHIGYFTNDNIGEYIAGITNEELKNTLLNYYDKKRFTIYPRDLVKTTNINLETEWLNGHNMFYPTFDIVTNHEYYSYTITNYLLLKLANQIYVCKETPLGDGAYERKFIYPIEKTYDEFFADYVA